MSAPDLAIVADLLFDGRRTGPLERPLITVAAGRVTSVEERPRDWSRPRDLQVVDLEGCTVLPGLIDAHVHLALTEKTAAEAIAFAESAPEHEILAVMREHAEDSLRAGVTTLRDCGSPGHTGVTAREALARGDWLGPRLLVSGRPITTVGGHCHWMGLTASTPTEVRDAVDELVAEGVDFIKVMVTGGMMTPGSDPYRPQYDREALYALVAEAHDADRRVAAHVLSSEGLRLAVDSGIDTIEHGWTITASRQDVDESLAAAMTSAGVYGSVTAHTALRSLLLEGDLDALSLRLAAHRRFRDAGVRIVVHSDAGTPGTRFSDFALSVEAFMAGMKTTMTEAVEAATALPAEAMGLGDDLGTVEPGKWADLIAVEGDLRDDVRALRHVQTVFLRGREVVTDGELRHDG
jgi:imidazolonepropionase-like amidohydrolase